MAMSSDDGAGSPAASRMTTEQDGGDVAPMTTIDQGDQAFAFNSPQSQGSALVGAQAQAFLSSFVAGDELSAVSQIDPAAQAAVGGDAASGVLIDPAAAETAFLSATQLAALDHDRFSIV
jgi:hypothetical protein